MPTDRNTTKLIVKTYAEALLEAAQKDDTVFKIQTEFGDVLLALHEHMELKDALGNVTYPGETRAAIARDVFAPLSPALVSVLALMAERGEFTLVPRVRDLYEEIAEEATNTIMVDVTTAVELTDELRDQIKAKFSKEYEGREVVLSERIDKSILGGIIMSTHGYRLDASIKNQLERTRSVLKSTPGGE